MRIGDLSIGPGLAPYVIAEIGVNHDGRADRALELVDAAAAAGANAVKFQVFRSDLLLGATSELADYQRETGVDSPEALLSRLELPLDVMAEAVAGAHKRGLHAIATIFNLELVSPALELPWDAIKIASPDIINRPLIDALRAAGRPMIMSTGAATLDEVLRALTWCGDEPLVLLQCVSAYPAPETSASLGGIAALRHATGRVVGYSDHTTAIDSGGLAVAAGAALLEKHLTHDREATGPDHAASLDPRLFAEYVLLAHRAHRMLGEAAKSLLDIERDVRRVSRQSVAAARDLDEGAIIGASDLVIRRPGTGIEPWRIAEVIGRRLRHAIGRGQPLRDEDLA